MFLCLSKYRSYHHGLKYPCFSRATFEFPQCFCDCLSKDERLISQKLCLMNEALPVGAIDLVLSPSLTEIILGWNFIANSKKNLLPKIGFSCVNQAGERHPPLFSVVMRMVLSRSEPRFVMNNQIIFTVYLSIDLQLGYAPRIGLILSWKHFQARTIHILHHFLQIPGATAHSMRTQQ